MYGDNAATRVSLKPNAFGEFGYDNPGGDYPLITDDYTS